MLTNDKNRHIPIAQIETDIADTEHEIIELEQRLHAYEILSINGPEEEKRLYRFKAGGIPFMIKERQEFINKLKILLEERKNEISR